jgi:uncharacterized integral membrane protein
MARKYTLYVDRNRVTSIELDGVSYKRAGMVPDSAERARVKRLVEGIAQSGLGKTAGKPASGMQKLFTTIFGSVAMVLMVIFIISTTLTVRSIFSETSAAGRVVDMVRRGDSSGSTFYYPVVEFPLQNGHLQTAEIAEGSWPAAYQLGDLVTVRYDAENPLKARIASMSSTIGAWTLPIIMGVLSAAFVGVLFLIRWIFSQDTPEGGEEEDSPAEVP